MSLSSVASNSEVILDSGQDVYQTISRAAVVSLTLAVLGLSSFMAVPLIVLPIAGLVFGLVGLSAIRRYPQELLGRPIAILGACLSGVTLLAGSLYHSYVYATEVPEGYTRVSFFSLAADKNQPDQPTAAAVSCHGQQIFIKGYVHPSSMASAMEQKFIIVPDLGTCCFGGQPPLTHMIEVHLTGDQYAYRNLRKKSLAGKFSVNPQLKPVNGLTGVYYELQADLIK
jgi:hypothetical protein